LGLKTSITKGKLFFSYYELLIFNVSILKSFN